MIDSHCHLTYIENIDKEIEDWKNRGVKAVVTSALDIDDGTKSLQLRERYPDFIFVCLGLHPSDIDKFSGGQLGEYIEFIKQNRKNIVALGEIGLDYNWVTDKNKQDRSKEIFIRMVKLANFLRLPLVIHSRNGKNAKESAITDTINILKENDAKKVAMHCFSGNESNLKAALDIGYLISYATNICWTKKHPYLASKTPLEQMLLETDSPWLDPDSGFEKKLENRPWKIAKSAEVIAKVKDVSVQHVLKITSDNTKKFFNI